MALPAQPSARVAALLKKMRASRGRLIFALDATASRQPTWDLACGLTSEMFAEVARIGGLEVQLAWYRGPECKSSAWTPDADELARTMRGITCEAGYTQIGKMLAHVREEHAREKVAAVVFIGDAVEESPHELYAAAGLGVPTFLFQEGQGESLVAHFTPRTVHTFHSVQMQSVEQVFRELARLTNGAYARFDVGAAAKLGELLRAVGAFATGGVAALANLRTDSARKLLGQLK